MVHVSTKLSFRVRLVEEYNTRLALWKHREIYYWEAFKAVLLQRRSELTSRKLCNNKLNDQESFRKNGHYVKRVKMTLPKP